MVALNADMHGAGFAMAHDSLAQGLIEEGRLVKPFRADCELNEAYFLIPPARGLSTPASEHFCEWILKQTGRV